MPRALHIAIPSTYNNTLFEDTPGKSQSHTEVQQHANEEQSHAEAQQEEENSAQHNGKGSEDAHSELVEALLQHGRKIKVVGVSPGPDKKHAYIIAGDTAKQSTGATQPVAVCINQNTTIIRHTGEPATPTIVEQLQEGTEIVAEGKKSKRGVIPATRVVV